MFEITATDIRDLSDEDLRGLVALLCESEVRSRGHSTKAVTWGGDQTAKDGGLDVRVSLPKRAAMTGFIPRANTGYQVKKPNMARAAILAEMRPKNKLRPVIKDLADKKGAYIIISSGSSVSDSALKERLSAMDAAVRGLKNRKDLALDFYDRSRLATWVRDHGGIVLWVRQKIGKSVPGWQPYGAWAYAPDGTESDYLLDDTVRVRTGQKDDGDGLSALDGLNRMRATMSKAGAVVRIVGLSGVGKTRFVQALFDNRVGTAPLDRSLAIYTNIADDPNPNPTAMATDLVNSKTKAVLIVDNCPADLHHRLSEICRGKDSTVSVLTVEYDIREDDPEGTEVFGLEPSSDKLIEKFVRRRFPALSQVDAGTVAQFSGGNARIAVALASTVGKNETLAGLTNADLFERLFRQRHQHDGDLLLSAQACSLVYSFNGEDTSEGPDAELMLLGACVGQSPDKVRQNVVELRRRELVQERSKWRAVLPHAIANQLAALALQNIAPGQIEANLIAKGSDRLLRSFSRRLGYLHKSDEAVAIAKKWLSAGGSLGDVTAFGELERSMFSNILPLAPEAGLQVLERAAQNATTDGHHPVGSHVRDIRQLAWDPNLFDRCVALLVSMSKGTTQRAQANDAPSVLKSLFPLYLSGTEASLEQRIAVATRLLTSKDAMERSLGESAWHELLEAWHFSSVYDFEFGARSRTHGYAPKTNADVTKWFTTVISKALELAKADPTTAPALRYQLGTQLRGIWTMAGCHAALENAAKELSKTGHWKEGWIGARQTLKFDVKKPSAAANRLEKFETSLRPADLVEKVRAMLLGDRFGSYDLGDFEDEDGVKPTLHTTARMLGKLVGTQPQMLKELLPELVSKNGELFHFGQGLADGRNDHRGLWDQVVTAFCNTDKKDRAEMLLRGVVSGIAEKDKHLANNILDKMLVSDDLAVHLPICQSIAGLDKSGLARLHRAVNSGKTPVVQFHYLAMGGAPSEMAPPELKKLVLAIAKKDGGLAVAFDIVRMRIHGDKTANRPIAKETISTGRTLLGLYQFTSKNDRDDHTLGALVKVSLAGNEGVKVAEALCKRLRSALLKPAVTPSNFDDLIKALVSVQPAAMLDGLVDSKMAAEGKRLADLLRMYRINALGDIPSKALMDWCAIAPAIRFPLAATILSPLKPSAEHEAKEFSDTALALLQTAPDPEVILKHFIERIYPRSYSGSLADILEKRSVALDALFVHPNPSIATLARAAKANFGGMIDKARLREAEENRNRDQSFE